MNYGHKYRNWGVYSMWENIISPIVLKIGQKCFEPIISILDIFCKKISNKSLVVFNRRIIGNKGNLLITRRMQYDGIIDNSFFPEYEKHYDYCRYRAVELVAEEIYRNSVNGNIVEAGVAQGDFAKILNKCFYDRKLYLYDTFEGFDEEGKAWLYVA